MTEEQEKAPEAEKNSEEKSEENQEETTSEEDSSSESEEKSEDKEVEESADEELDSEKSGETEEVGEDDQGRKLYKTSCSKCGKECEVPFKPEKGRDVFCEDCFKSKRKRSFGGSRGPRRRNRQMHDATCAECGKKCQVPFKPTGDKPVYCRDCYSNKRQ